MLSEYQKLGLSRYTLQQSEEAIKLLQKRIKLLTGPGYNLWLEKPIWDLPLTTRARTSRFNSGIKTAGDLVNYGLDRIEGLKGCGTSTLKKIRDVILKEMPGP